MEKTIAPQHPQKTQQHNVPQQSFRQYRPITPPKEHLTQDVHPNILHLPPCISVN